MKKYIFILVTIIWIGIIFFMSAKPGDDSDKSSYKFVTIICEVLELNSENKDKINFVVRKTAHFTEYFILSVLVTLTYEELFNKKYNFSTILLICVFVALSDELLQSFVPGRSSKVADVFIDSSGALFGLLISNLIPIKQKVN